MTNLCGGAVSVDLRFVLEALSIVTDTLVAPCQVGLPQSDTRKSYKGYVGRLKKSVIDQVNNEWRSGSHQADSGMHVGRLAPLAL